ncbi:cupin domain-containing protein [Ideonella sp. A 288]|uniref:cupin domain-containing protein n=1 Tax=Ideonella sp. A 288 TaxID=1962181 RepID=UPI000B4BBE25|nr:cupin domain-containing protein [Ideonella sp. A 288]
MTALRPDAFIREQGDAPAAGAPNLTLWISEAGGLGQFGAFVEVLQPGTRSSLAHWHSAEDEMVYVLEGQVTLVEGTTETVLHPGDAATFKAGVPVGHCLWNRSAAPTRCLVVGTRAPLDRITYPELDRVRVRDRSLPDDTWTTIAGAPASSPFA